MRIRFQADADLKHAIVAGTLRRAASVDFRRAESVPLEGLADIDVRSVSGATGRPPQGLTNYAVRCVSLLSPLIAACAAASRAIGTRYGEQET